MRRMTAEASQGKIGSGQNLAKLSADRTTIMVSAAYTSQRHALGSPLGLLRTNPEIRSGFAIHASEYFKAAQPMISMQSPVPFETSKDRTKRPMLPQC